MISKDIGCYFFMQRQKGGIRMGIIVNEAKNRCSCNVCKAHTDNLYDLYFGSINICLCTSCFSKTIKVMSQAEAYINVISEEAKDT